MGRTARRFNVEARQRLAVLLLACRPAAEDAAQLAQVAFVAGVQRVDPTSLCSRSTRPIAI